MSDDSNGKAPISFYIIGGLFLVWNVIGLLFYYQQMTLTPEAIASMGPEIAAFMEVDQSGQWNAITASAIGWGSPVARRYAP